jgi:hypothetical protein
MSFDKSDAGRGRFRPDGHEYDSRYISKPSWPWLTTGIVLAACFLLLLLGARSCGQSRAAHARSSAMSESTKR